MVNGTGDPALADEVVARLTAAGLTVGTVTTAEAGVSGIEHPEGESAGAQWLAEALGGAAVLRETAVLQVTVVLGATDSAPLVAAVDALPACAD
ncbi:LytR C-terminal domain-containing protein [Modestobacter versicolor]|uniref:LytR C-terminal domain-containing protein n=1 Tax=Modestobacter versicolor TaxID=429133 RepID=UPI0015E8A1B2|nr:LytR C-terminal domain-containing protein [Modestobacter versicolor]